MKIIIFLTTLLLLSGNTWSQGSDLCLNWGGIEPCPYENNRFTGAICGITSRSKIDGERLTLLSTRTGTHYEIFANTKKAQAFLDLASSYGAHVCNTKSSFDAPFEICFIKESSREYDSANLIFCGRKMNCSGPTCGGNGISVNSGEI